MPEQEITQAAPEKRIFAAAMLAKVRPGQSDIYSHAARPAFRHRTAALAKAGLEFAPEPRFFHP